MGSAPGPLCLVVFITISTTTFFFFNSQLMGDAWDLNKNPAESGTSSSSTITSTSADLGFLDDGKEGEVEVVTGEDNVGGDVRTLMLEKFRVLLGLKSSKMGRLRSNSVRMRHGFSPAPAPAEEEAAAPAPAVQLFDRRSHRYSHSPLPRPSHVQPAQDVELQKKNVSKARVGRIVIAALVSTGATLAIIALTVVLVCHRSRRNRKNRSEMTMLVSRIGGGIGGSKITKASNTMNRVSFDPDLELFYLNSLAPAMIPEQVSSPKQSSETKSRLSDESESSSPGEPMKFEADSVSCSAEEILPVEESLSSDGDDESFHSVCNSHSSPSSETNTTHHSEISTTFDFAKESPSPDHSLKALIQLSPRKSPILPHISSNSDSSPSHAYTSPPRTSLPMHSPIATRITCSSNSQMTLLAPCIKSNGSKNSHPRDLTLSNSSNTESFSNSNAMKARQESIVSSSHPTNHGTNQSPSTPLPIRTGNVPKPPPPPLPPFRPPLFKTGGSHGQPPPPPPFHLQPHTPVGKDGAPLPKLKPLHWDKVRAAPDRSMVWDKIRSSSFELNEEMIESLFGYKLQSSAKNEEMKNKTSSPTKHVLEPQRLQNFTILLKALNATAEQVCEALLQGGGLCAQQLEALVKMAPTKEEEEMLSNYEGNINELVPVEKIVRKILSIPFAFSRIEVMLYRETFEDEVVHLKKSFGMLEEACRELRSSRHFLRLLEAVLKTGNRMNVGTTRGGARAFKLDALLKLADVKGTDGKTTLLHFVVREMIRSEGSNASSEMSAKKVVNLKTKPETPVEKEEDYRIMGLELVSGLSTELCNVKKTAGIDLDVLASSVSNLSIGMEKLRRLVLGDDLNGSFVRSMKSFLNHAERRIKELEEDEDRVLLHVREITEYYHGDLSKEESNPLRIFVIVRDFLATLDRVCKEVRSLKSHHSANPFR